MHGLKFWKHSTDPMQWQIHSFSLVATNYLFSFAENSKWCMRIVSTSNGGCSSETCQVRCTALLMELKNIGVPFVSDQYGFVFQMFVRFTYRALSTWTFARSKGCWQCFTVHWHRSQLTRSNGLSVSGFVAYMWKVYWLKMEPWGALIYILFIQAYVFVRNIGKSMCE